MALRVACRSGRSDNSLISDRHPCGDQSWANAAGEQSPSADRHLHRGERGIEYRDPDSARQRNSHYHPYGHSVANAHGDLHAVDNRHSHCTGDADPYTNAKPDSYVDSDAFTSTRTPSSHRDTCAEIGIKLTLETQDDHPT